MGQLSENLARYRKGRDLSQEQLAEAAAVGVDTVARIEQGVRTTSRPATLRRLAAALDVTVDQLLGQMPAKFVPVDVAPLRRAITGGEHVPGLSDFAEDAETVSSDQLARSAHRAWRAYVDGRHLELFDRDPTRAGVFGNLLFNAASAALLEDNGSRADDLLAEANAAAARAGADTATEAAIFGPRVAALQQIDSIARSGDPETAMRRAARVPDAQGEVPAFWEAGHRLRLAAAAIELRRDRQALELLAESRDLAPDWVRYQPLGTSTMRRLVDRAARRRGAEFAELASRPFS